MRNNNFSRASSNNNNRTKVEASTKRTKKRERRKSLKTMMKMVWLQQMKPTEMRTEKRFQKMASDLLMNMEMKSLRKRWRLI